MKLLLAVAISMPLLSGCASAPRERVAENPLSADQRRLDGVVARIELGDGQVVERATHVRLGATVTSWRVGPLPSEAPTSEVARITIRPGRYVLRGAKIGALTGLAIGTAPGAYGNPHGWASFGVSTGEAVAIALVLAPVAGSVVGALAGLHRNPGGIVFEQVVAATRAGGIALDQELEPASCGGWRSPWRADLSTPLLHFCEGEAR